MSSIGTRAGVCSTFIPTPGGYANFVVKGNTNTLVKGLKFRSKSSRVKYRLLKVYNQTLGLLRVGMRYLLQAGISVVLDTIKACYGQNLESIR